MGWQDDPVVEDEPQASSQPWMSDPVDSSAPQPPPPMPTMGEVALNAVPKGVANVLNTSNFINHLVLKGVASLPGMDSMPGVKKFLEEGAEKFSRNGPQHLMEMSGIIDPAKAPQTGPQRIVDAAIQGAVSAAVAPGAGLAGAAKSAAMGAVSGASGKTAEEFMKPIVGETAAHWIGVATGAILPVAPLLKPSFRVVKPAPQSELNTKTRLDTLRAAQEEGFVVPPMSVRPSMGNQSLESLAGGGKLNIAMSTRNQKVATETAKKDIGLPVEAELIPDTFVALKTEAAKPYRELEQLGGSLMDTKTKQIYSGGDLLKQVQQKRSDAAALWRNYGNMEKPSPEVRELARAATNEAERFEDMIDQLAKASKVPGLLNRVRGARTALAKIYDVEAATNVGDGHVSMPVLGAMLDGGKKMSGKIETVAKFWNMAKPVSREGASLGNTASGTDAMAAGLSAVASGGSLLGMIPVAGPIMRNMARDRAMSPEVQKSLLSQGRIQGMLDMRPAVARGLSRAALISSALHNTEEDR